MVTVEDWLACLLVVFVVSAVQCSPVQWSVLLYCLAWSSFIWAGAPLTPLSLLNIRSQKVRAANCGARPGQGTGQLALSTQWGLSALWVPNITAVLVKTIFPLK